MIYVGIDWAEAHHDVCIEDGEGHVLAKGRVPDGIEGVERIHEMLGAHVDEPAEVAIGIELDRGLLVGALVGAGYEVHAVNPFAVSRYRDRSSPAGAKSDPGDARVLAEVMRTDGHLHREVAGDSVEAEAVKVLARAHQNLIWTRQRIGNQLRSVLREFYPGALKIFSDLVSADAIAVLEIAPTPSAGRALKKATVRKALAAGGRKRRLEERSTEIIEGLRAPQLGAPVLDEEAFGHQVASHAVVLATLRIQIEEPPRRARGFV
jgi:transposase